MSVDPRTVEAQVRRLSRYGRPSVVSKTIGLRDRVSIMSASQLRAIRDAEPWAGITADELEALAAVREAINHELRRRGLKPCPTSTPTAPAPPTPASSSVPVVTLPSSMPSRKPSEPSSGRSASASSPPAASGGLPTSGRSAPSILPPPPPLLSPLPNEDAAMLDKSTAQTKPQPKTRNSISHKEAVTLALEMAKVCRVGADGFAVYDEGWSDEKVHRVVNALLGREISLKSVIYSRIENIGKLRPATPPPFTTASDELTALRGRVAKLELTVFLLLEKLGEPELAKHIDLQS